MLATTDQIDEILGDLPDSFFDASSSPDRHVTLKLGADKNNDDDDAADADDIAVSGDEAPKKKKKEPTPPPTSPAAAAPAPAPPKKPSPHAAKDPKQLIADMLTQASKFYSNDGPVVLDAFQQKAVDAAMAGHNILITGQAGSGKSVVLRELNRRSCEAGEVCNNVAHNGIAAANINGLTINSFAGLGTQFHAPYNVKKIHADAKTRIKVTKKLIIDEISTVSNHMLDGLDVLFREVTGNLDQPFGGIQIIACGDFAQLKPIDDSEERERTQATLRLQGQAVVNKNEETYAKMSPYLRDCLTDPKAPIDFCWLAKSWKYFKDNIFLLKTPYRQGACPVYRKILAETRIGRLSEESHQLLSAKARQGSRMEVPDDYTMLMSHRKDVHSFNLKRLLRLPAETGRAFKAADHYENDFYKKLLQNIPLQESFEARVGSRVLLKKNIKPADKEGRELVNGSVGTIVGWTCHTSTDSSKVARPIHGLVFSNPGCARSSADIKPYSELAMPNGARPVTLSFASKSTVSMERQKSRVDAGYTSGKEELECSLYASNGFLPLPVVYFDNGDYVVCTPTKWAIEINKREEIAEDEQELAASGRQPHKGANGGVVSVEDMRKLARITETATPGPRAAGQRKQKRYRTVPHEVAFRIQIPLQLANAISVHASQGLTVEKLAVNLGRTIFDKGQAYVALSRGTVFDKLIVTEYTKDAVTTDPRVTKFYNILDARATQSEAAPVEVDARQDSELSKEELFKRVMDRRRKTALAKALEM